MPLPPEHSATVRRTNTASILALIACASLLIMGAIISLTATNHKSATYDEPLHLAAGLSHALLHDFRADFEAPPLFKYWAALPNLSRRPKLVDDDTRWRSMLRDRAPQWEWAVSTIY